MAPLTDVFQRLRERNEPVPVPATLPSASEVDAIETKLKTSFHPDFREYLLKVSDVVYGTKEPVTIVNGGHTDLLEVAQDAWEAGLPRDSVPICGDNGDYYAISPNGEVFLWVHDGLVNTKWPSLADWIDKVWLENR